jgi:lipid-binding SYLF domain-containing protein
MRIFRLGRRLGTAGIIALTATLASAAGAQVAAQVAEPDEAKVDAGALVTKAKKAVQEFRASQVSARFRASVRKGRAILIVPEFERAGFGLGGEGGSGVLLKKLARPAGWTYPAFFEVGGPTLGFQAGYEKGALLIVIHDQQTLNEIMNGELAFGAEARALAGSKGVMAQTTTSAGHRIDLFMNSTGAFAGAMLKGGDIRPVKRLNVGYYGVAVGPSDILKAKGRANIHADGLRAALSELVERPPAPMHTN